MNIILGFGSIEVAMREKIKNELLSSEDKPSVEKRYKAEAEVFDKMPRSKAPERYTYFFLYDEKIVFHHINRQHALSPDGWALLVVEEPFLIAVKP